MDNVFKEHVHGPVRDGGLINKSLAPHMLNSFAILKKENDEQKKDASATVTSYRMLNDTFKHQTTRHNSI